MKTITVKNLTTLTEMSALARIVGWLNNEADAVQDRDGEVAYKINRRGDVITIAEADELYR